MDSIITRELVFAKYLYKHGCAHALNKDVESRMIAAHNFDSTVEIILKCIIKERGIQNFDLGNSTVLDMLEKLGDIPFEAELKELHKLRNLVQQQGEVPSNDSISKNQKIVEGFLEGIFLSEFKIPYDGLFLGDIIENEAVKKKAIEAEVYFNKKEYNDSIRSCNELLQFVVFEHTKLAEWACNPGEGKKALSLDELLKVKKYRCYDALIHLGEVSSECSFLGEFESDFLIQREIIGTLDSIPDYEMEDDAHFIFNFTINFLLKLQQEGIIAKG